MQMQTSTTSSAAYLRTDLQPQAKLTFPQSEQSFGDMIADWVQRTNETQHDASTGLRDLIAGNVDNVHEVVLKSS